MVRDSERKIRKGRRWGRLAERRTGESRMRETLRFVEDCAFYVCYGGGSCSLGEGVCCHAKARCLYEAMVGPRGVRACASSLVC